MEIHFLKCFRCGAWRVPVVPIRSECSGGFACPCSGDTLKHAAAEIDDVGYRWFMLTNKTARADDFFWNHDSRPLLEPLLL